MKIDAKKAALEAREAELIARINGRDGELSPATYESVMEEITEVQMVLMGLSFQKAMELTQ